MENKHSNVQRKRPDQVKEKKTRQSRKKKLSKINWDSMQKLVNDGKIVAESGTICRIKRKRYSGDIITECTLRDYNDKEYTLIDSELGHVLVFALTDDVDARIVNVPNSQR